LNLAVEKIQTNQKGFKLNGTLQLLVYGGGLNLFDSNIYTIKTQNI
jgi:hypothetical protein